MENKLKIFVAGLSDYSNKLCSLDKLSPLIDFSSSTYRHCQRVTNSEILLRPRWHISSPSLTRTEICCLYRRRHLCYLTLPRYYWSSNHIDHFRSALSLFRTFIFHQKWFSNSSASYCRSPHETENYFWILWNNWTQSWCMHHPWSKIPPTKS